MNLTEKQAIEMYNRQYADTHLEFSVLELLTKGKKSELSFPDDSSILPSGEIRGKRKIEREAAEKRDKDLRHMLLDAVAVRKLEILDAEKLPIKDLLRLVVDTSKRDGPAVAVNFSFADMVLRANQQKRDSKEKAVDIESNATDDS